MNVSMETLILPSMYFEMQWNPPSLEQVTTDMVDQYFSPLTSLEPDLELPIKTREAFT